MRAREAKTVQNDTRSHMRVARRAHEAQMVQNDTRSDMRVPWRAREAKLLKSGTRSDQKVAGRAREARIVQNGAHLGHVCGSIYVHLLHGAPRSLRGALQPLSSDTEISVKGFYSLLKVA